MFLLWTVGKVSDVLMMRRGERQTLRTTRQAAKCRVGKYDCSPAVKYWIFPEINTSSGNFPLAVQWHPGGCRSEHLARPGYVPRLGTWPDYVMSDVRSGSGHVIRYKQSIRITSHPDAAKYILLTLSLISCVLIWSLYDLLLFKYHSPHHKQVWI